MTAFASAPASEYRGHCRRCDREHTFENDVPLAVSALADLFEQIEKDETFVTVHAALEASHGKMIGVLVAESTAGTRQVLRAYSGELAGRRAWPDWVGPVMRREDTRDLEVETLARIAALDEQIAACDVDGAQQRLFDAREALHTAAAERRRAYRAEQAGWSRARSEGVDATTIAASVAAWKRHHDEPATAANRVEASRQALLAEKRRLRALRDQRRDASRVLSTAFFDNAGVTNARGERRPLRDIFVGSAIVGGTTDCTVPKLLEAANVAGLRPIALTEAWWGTTLNGRHHGDVQAPCDRRCKPILGHLLCGLDEAPSSP